MSEVLLKDIMSKDLMYVDYNDKVLEVAQKMFEKGVGSVIVKKSGIAAGIMTERDIIRNCVTGSKNIFNTIVGVIWSVPIISVKDNQSVLYGSRVMKSKNIKKLVVIDDNENISGIVTLTDIVRDLNTVLNKYDEMDGVSVIIPALKEIMVTDLYYADYNDAVVEVVALMGRVGVGSIIIMKNGIPEGIMTERDIVKNCIIGEKNFIKLRTKDIMSKPLISLKESQSVVEGANLMDERHIKKIVVLDRLRKLAGIVTQTDIVYSLGVMVRNL